VCFLDQFNRNDHENLQDELTIMQKIKPHANIINLIGCCTSSDGPLCVIMEYAEHGNLHSFLKECSPSQSRYKHNSNSSTSSTSSSPSCPLMKHVPLSHQTSLSSHTPLSAQASITTAHTYLHCSTGGHYTDSPTISCLSPKTIFSHSTNTTFNNITDHLTSLMPTAHQVWPLLHDYIRIPTRLNPDDFYNFALQIASGLEHLNDMKVGGSSRQ
jgi:hypothetical protein